MFAGCADRRGVSPWIAIVIMVGITLIIAGIMYVWVTSLADTSSAVSKAYQNSIGKQEVPAEPMSVDITTMLDVKYLLIEGELTCTYKMAYSATFVYEPTPTPSSTILPLPKGSIESLALRLNGADLRPEISNNRIQLSLPQGQYNTVYISYKSIGMDEYLHSVPENRLIEIFNMRLEITGADQISQKDLPADCLIPDKITHPDGSTVMEWTKTNTILKKGIEVKLPKKTNPYDSYLYLLFVMIVAMVLVVLFYREIFLRLGMEWRVETLGFIAAPMLVLYLLLGLALMFLPPWFSVIGVLLLYVGGVAFIDLRMLHIKKRVYEGFVFNSSIMIFACTVIFFFGSTGLVIAILSSIAVIVTVVNLLRRFKRPAPKDENKEFHIIEELNKRISGLVCDKNLQTCQIKELLDQNNQMKKAVKTKEHDKRYCIYCGRKIDTDFEFCPACGRDLKEIKKCQFCHVIMTGTPRFCPNCRSENYAI